MPQPESCSSDWRMRGFSASTSSCRIETGSADTQPNTRHMTPTPYRGEKSPSAALPGHGTEHVRAPSDLVGAPAEAVRAGAAGRRGEEPPRRAPGGRDRVPEDARGLDGGERDAHAPQPRRLRGGRARVAPRAGAERGRGRRPAGGAAAAAEARPAPPRRGGDPRRPSHGFRGGGLRSAHARGARHGSGGGARGGRTSGPEGDTGGVRAGGGEAGRGGGAGARGRVRAAVGSRAVASRSAPRFTACTARRSSS